MVDLKIVWFCPEPGSRPDCEVAGPGHLAVERCGHVALVVAGVGDRGPLHPVLELLKILPGTEQRSQQGRPFYYVSMLLHNDLWKQNDHTQLDRYVSRRY